MSQGWRMRAYMDVLAASVRLWMILEKRKPLLIIFYNANLLANKASN